MPKDYMLKLRHTGSFTRGGGVGPLVGEDVSFTLSTSQDQTLFQDYNSIKSDATIKVGSGEDAAYTLRVGGDGGTNDIVRDGYIVRRLTPLECERLQGFPDNWTDVPYRGKEHAPDTARYKACGNSMAVPVMRWIGERIQEVDAMLKERDAE